jgi:DNA-binding Lrp family transcriptional regulator/CheY-like chemotaxis protein
MYRLDTLDRQIISHLQQDGRMPYVELARALDVSEATARRRVERLCTAGIVSIVACVEPRHVGLQAEALIYLQADLDKLTQIGQRLAAMPEAREVLYTSGALQAEKRLDEWQMADLPEASPPAGPGPCILLVDDDADFVAAARMVLEAAGYCVVTAGSSREALARLETERPALVLLDLMMETPLAGLVVARAVRANRWLRGVPLLAISAIHSSEWADRLPPTADLPLDDFVDKPIEPQLLLDKVRRFIG